MPVNENVADATAVSPLGPPMIVVSGGVLSTMTTRAAVAGLPAASVALAARVWLPSATVVVSQVAVAVRGEAGGGGVTAAESGCAPTARLRRLTPLASVARACTATDCRR